MSRVKSEITLYKNVPIQPNFKNEPLFDSVEEQKAWFKQFEYKKFTGSYQKTEEQIRSPYKYEDLVDVNYVKVVNPSYDGANEEKTTWYGVIMGINYINDELVLIDWVVNPVQTFMHRIKYGKATIDRGMAKLPTKNKEGYYTITDNRIPILSNTEPIGIDGLGVEIARDNVIATKESDSRVVFMIIVLKNADNRSYVGTPGQRAYYVIPFNKVTGELINFRVHNVQEATSSGIITKTLEASNNKGQNILGAVEDIISDFDLTAGGGDLLACYLQNDIGIGFDFTTSDTLEATLNDYSWSVTGGNMEIYPKGNSSTDTGGGGGSTGGNVAIPSDKKEFLSLDVGTDFGVDEAKFLAGAKRSARVQSWLGNNDANIKRVADIVRKNGMSPELFFAYDIQEGGTSWGWLNHTYYTGDPYTDADSVSKWAVSQANTTGRVELAWTDVANPYYTTPVEKQKEGQAFADALPKGAIGRMYLSGTAAATWAAFDPEALKGSVNGVQDYGDPIKGCMDLLKSWGATAGKKAKASQSVANGLNHLKSLLNQTVGNGECYALSAEYSGYMGGCGLGAGTKYPLSHVIGNTSAASDIGIAYDWASVGWKVIKNPSYDQLVVGSIINWSRGAVVDGWNADQTYGHTGVIRGLSNNRIQTYEQNTEKGRIFGEFDRPYNGKQSISSIVIPPNAESGGNGNDEVNDGGSSGGSASSSGRKWLKINVFMNPKERKRAISFENTPDGAPKYHQIRKALNAQLQKTDPATINYINSLQGEWGLEKLCCAPFTTILLTTGKGSQKDVSLSDFKNQSEPFKVNIRGFLDLSNWVELYFDDYLTYFNDINDETIEANIRKNSIIDNTPKSIELVIDAEDQYLYLNKNRLQQSRDNAAFSRDQTKIQLESSNRNFNTSQESARTSLSMQQSFDRKNLQTQQTQGWFNTAYSAATNALSATMTGGLKGLGASVVGSAIGAGGQWMQNQFDTMNQSMLQSQASAMQAQQQQAESKIFRNSLDTASLIATNNYENAIANINAGLADMRLQPDVSAISASGYNFEMAWDNDDYYVILYTVNPHQLRVIAEFFARFGYSIKLYDDIDRYLRIRSSFNYIKTIGANIQGDFSNKWREALNLIFDNGITLWRNHEKMAQGDITYNL